MADEPLSPHDTGFLVDMLENARTAARVVSGKTWDEFLADEVLHDAVTCRVGIIGEASRNVSDRVRLLMPAVPWANIRAMRNVLFHDYHGVDLRKVWEVAVHHAPTLVSTIERFLADSGIRKQDFTPDEDAPRA